LANAALDCYMKKIKNKNNFKKIIINAAQNIEQAREYTHTLYRYPASMSPVLVRNIIQYITEPGDLILDPFCGGGTTAIEALSNGRKIICSDINKLAIFLTTAKAWPLKDEHIIEFEKWSLNTLIKIKNKKKYKTTPLKSKTGKIFSPKTSSILIYLADLADKIKDIHVRRVALLTIIRTAKYYFDCNKYSPAPQKFINTFETNIYKTIKALNVYSSECFKWEISNNIKHNFKVYNSDVINIYKKINSKDQNISLVITSPPYPGIHVLYNRWQINSRFETDLPYSLLRIKDGKGSSHYTFGDRKQINHTTFFNHMEASFLNLKNIINRNTIIAQIISFSNPNVQLDKYMDLMDKAGYKELINVIKPEYALSRHIPNRKWYANLKDDNKYFKEYILFHRRK
jgi:DNA modification methylase